MASTGFFLSKRSGMRGQQWLLRAALGMVMFALTTVVLPVAAQMDSVDRPVDPRLNPFLVAGSLTPAVPTPGETVEISAEIRSRIHPHIRVLVAFSIDGQKREEQAYVIAPLAESIVVHEWKAQPGDHVIRIDVTSPAGVRYTSWEQRLSVKGR